MYFDRILFSAVFATLFTTATLALVPADRAADVHAATEAAGATPVYRLEPVVVTAKREDARI
jgi:hypothetical protein